MNLFAIVLQASGSNAMKKILVRMLVTAVGSLFLGAIVFVIYERNGIGSPDSRFKEMAVHSGLRAERA